MSEQEQEERDPDLLRVIADADQAPFGVIAGRRMTRVMVSPIDRGMQKLGLVETKDWFPLGVVPTQVGDDGDDVQFENWLAFAVAVEDISWWIDHLGS